MPTFRQSKWIVVYGNVVEGLQFVGPFETQEAAVKYTNDDLHGDWKIAELYKPAPPIEGDA